MPILSGSSMLSSAGHETRPPEIADESAQRSADEDLEILGGAAGHSLRPTQLGGLTSSSRYRCVAQPRSARRQQ